MLPLPFVLIVIGLNTTQVIVSLTGSDSLPAASTLLTRTVLIPGLSAREADQLVVPLAGWKGPLPNWQSTCTTPLLSLAEPCKITVPLVNRALAGGNMIDTDGATESGV